MNYSLADFLESLLELYGILLFGAVFVIAPILTVCYWEQIPFQIGLLWAVGWSSAILFGIALAAGTETNAEVFVYLLLVMISALIAVFILSPFEMFRFWAQIPFAMKLTWTFIWSSSMAFGILLLIARLKDC